MKTIKGILLSATIIFFAAQISPAQWTIDSMGSPHYNMLVAKFDTRALFVTGSWDMYDASTATWSSGVLSTFRNEMRVAQTASKAYFAGGKTLTYDPVYVNTINVYNTASNVWYAATLSKARSVGGAGTLGNKVFFAGGRDALTMSNRVDIFDGITDVRTTATLSKGRDNIAVGASGTKIVFAGGWFFDFSYNSVLSNAVDIYDNTTGLWTTATLSQKREEISVAVAGNKILFAGGFISTGSGISDNVDIYDVSTNTWTVSHLSVPRYDMTVNVVGSKAYFAGSGNGSNTVDVYDVSTGTWSVLTMPYTLIGMCGTVIDNQIFYAGGYYLPTFEVSDVVQIYNTISGTWSTQNLSQARAGIASVTFSNVTLFAGGATKVTYPAIGSSRVDIYTSILCSATITPSGNLSICGGSLLLTANSSVNTSYQWYKNSSVISGATNQIYQAKKSAMYYVVETNSSGCTATSNSVNLTVLTVPPAIINPLGNLDICNTGSVDLQANAGAGYLYQWMKGSAVLIGATNQIYTATVKGNYKVVVTNSDGCGKTSNILGVVKSCKQSFDTESGVSPLTCYPNPSNGLFTIDMKMNDAVSGTAMIEIFNTLNQCVYSDQSRIGDGALQKLIDVSALPDGMYTVKVTVSSITLSKQLIIQH